MAHHKHIKGNRAELIAAEYFTPTKKQKELGVQLVFVDLDKREVLDVLPQKPRKRHNPNVVNLKDYKKVTRKEII